MINCTYMTINYHVISKTLFYRNTVDTNCTQSRDNFTLTTTITKYENVNNYHVIIA